MRFTLQIGLCVYNKKTTRQQPCDEAIMIEGGCGSAVAWVAWGAYRHGYPHWLRLFWVEQALQIIQKFAQAIFQIVFAVWIGHGITFPRKQKPQTQWIGASGPKGIRTLDLYNAIVALSQLSYRPAVESILAPAYGIVNSYSSQDTTLFCS